jgi:hypothetical protein
VTLLQRPRLPDPAKFDPVRFPGVAADEEWPPRLFDFEAAWIRGSGHCFERGPSGEVIFVRAYEQLRLVLDIETAHSALDINPRGRDFRLLRLIPSALRLVEVVRPGDAVPPPLRGEEMHDAGDHHLYAATTALAEALGQGEGPEGQALLSAFRRVPPGAHMFEMAAARCVAQGGFAVERVALLAKALQRLAFAHAGVLAAYQAGPDWNGMERMVAAACRVQTRDARWSGSLLAHGLQKLEAVIGTPRQTAEALMGQAKLALVSARSLRDVPVLVREQADIRTRLTDLAHFWRGCAAAWASVHAETTDRNQIEDLARHAIRRMSLPGLYDPP